MKVIVVNTKTPEGVVLDGVNVIPRIGDSLCLWDPPFCVVENVLLYPTEEYLISLKVVELEKEDCIDVDAVVLVR